MPTRSGGKKIAHILRRIQELTPEWALLAEDETGLRLFPPLDYGWAKRGEVLAVPIHGRNAQCTVFGVLNLRTGRRLFEARDEAKAQDFQAFLDLVREHYATRPVAMLLDENSIHLTPSSLVLAEDLEIELLFLPVRSPHLNPLDHLWGKAKEVLAANRQYDSIETQVDWFVSYLMALSPRDALRKAGLCSERFWLTPVVSHYF